MTELEIENADQFVKINDEICNYVLGPNHSPESASRFLHGPPPVLPSDKKIYGLDKIFTRPQGLLNYVPRRFRHRINEEPHLEHRRYELLDRARRNASWGM